jgi:hypothetical protein
MDRAKAAPATIEKWADNLHRWAADGLVLLGGTIDDHLDDEGWSRHDAAALHLLQFDAPSDVLPQLDYLLQSTTAHAVSQGDLDDQPDLACLIRRCVAYVELVQFLSGRLAVGIATRPLVTRPPEYAKRELIEKLSEIYHQLYGHKPSFSRTPGHAGNSNRRDIIPTGPTLKWFRCLLDRIAGRSDDPVIRELARWGQRPDTIPEMLRKISDLNQEIIP